MRNLLLFLEKAMHLFKANSQFYSDRVPALASLNDGLISRRNINCFLLRVASGHGVYHSKRKQTRPEGVWTEAGLVSDGMYPAVQPTVTLQCCVANEREARQKGRLMGRE